MGVKLLIPHHLEFLRLKGGCTGSSESTHVKMPHCWKSYDAAHIILQSCISAARRGQNKYGFTFDRVFQPTSTQSEVFEEISQLVQVTPGIYNRVRTSLKSN